jgi:hypothetical protein
MDAAHTQRETAEYLAGGNRGFYLRHDDQGKSAKFVEIRVRDGVAATPG